MISKRKRIKKLARIPFSSKTISATQKQMQQTAKGWFITAIPISQPFCTPSHSIKSLVLPPGKLIEESSLEDLESCKQDDIKAEKTLQIPKVNPRVVINGKDGCICNKCKEFYPFAESNMSDGSMICYSCRNPW